MSGGAPAALSRGGREGCRSGGGCAKSGGETAAAAALSLGGQLGSRSPKSGGGNLGSQERWQSIRGGRP